MKPLNVLAIEDDPSDTAALKRALEHSQVPHQLQLASTGRGGLELLRTGRVLGARRLVLLDRRLPDMQGEQVLEEMRADPTLQHVPVVVLTAYDDEGGRELAHKLGTGGYFIKPQTYEALERLVKTALLYWSSVEFL